jgi:peptide/nickel transport system substrate-binding protein
VTEPIEQVLRIGAVKDFKLAIEGRNLVFETLVSLDEAGNPGPRLAESWKVTDDGMTYTFHLRKGVIFHDGTPFNAETAKFALEWLRNNARFGKYVGTIEVLDEYTVQLQLNEFYYPLLIDLGYEGNGKIISPTAVDPQGDPTGKLVEYVGTGPFKLVDYQKDQEAILVRNEDYWGQKPALEKVIWMTVPDAHTQIVALKAGELDIIGAPEHHSSVPYVEIPELEGDPNLVVMKHSYGRYQVIRFNCSREPFTDKRVREAINYGIDRETMVRSLFGDVTEPANLIMAPWFRYGPSNLEEGYSYDPDKARELLAEAGWKDTDNDGILDKDGKPLSFELLVPAGEANADVVVIFVQSELKKLGIQMDIVTLESSAAWDRKKKGEYDAFVHHSGCIPWSPQGVLQQEHLSTVGGFKHYSSPELDQLIEKAFTTRDETERQVTYDKIWELLQGESVGVPLYDIVKVVVFRKNVHGFEFPATMYETGIENVELIEP